MRALSGLFDKFQFYQANKIPCFTPLSERISMNDEQQSLADEMKV